MNNSNYKNNDKEKNYLTKNNHLPCSKHGGKRKGSGRKLKFNEPTKVIRVPHSMHKNILHYINDDYSLPLFLSKVPAGFPSPADDYMDCKLNLNDYLIDNPVATFLARASGNSMINAGINDGDLLVIDRSKDFKNRSIVVASLNGELTVKRYIKKNNKSYLMPENSDFEPIEIKEEYDIHLWGVVTSVIHKF